MVRRRNQQVHRITTAQPDPTPEQLSRERTYLAMMATRMVAIVVAVVVPGFWRWVAIAAGVLLPYVAVVMVNAARTRGAGEAEDPFTPEARAALASPTAPASPSPPSTAPTSPAPTSPAPTSTAPPSTATRTVPPPAGGTPGSTSADSG